MHSERTGAAGPPKSAAPRGAIAAGVAIAIGGVGAEIVSGAPVAAAMLDWLVGAAFATAALRWAATDRHATLLGLLCAATWYMATAAPAAGSGVLHWLGMLTTLAYRGPLMHWVVRRAGVGVGHGTAVVLLVGYVVALTGTIISAWGTIAVAGVLAVGRLVTARHGNIPADLRRSLVATAWMLAGLGVVWGLSLLGTAVGPVITTVGLLTVAWHLSRATSGLSGALGEIVLDLGPSGQPASPVAASLAKALADPDLLIRTFQPDTGWTDDRGRPVGDPEAERGERAVTAVTTVAGGRVMLVHGPKGAGDTELARAAAQAAALALESVRVEALVRRQAFDVRLSAARLVTVDDTQRRVLAERLSAGTIARLERIRRSRCDHADDPFDAEIVRIIDDLRRLAEGLNPAALADGRAVREAIDELARRADVPVGCDLDENLDRLADDSAALVYYATSECLTNIARHAHATAAHLRVKLDRTLVLDLHDNGRGGAVANPGGGLQGLADRIAIAGGTLRVHSPAGGPTAIRIEVPDAVRKPPGVR